MALNGKKTWISSVIQAALESHNFDYTPSSIRFSAHQYYFEYCIMSEHGFDGLSEYKIVLKVSGFCISGTGILFMRLRSS